MNYAQLISELLPLIALFPGASSNAIIKWVIANPQDAGAFISAAIDLIGKHPELVQVIKDSLPKHA